MNTVIGIDPDSKKYGVAIYEDGTLAYIGGHEVVSFVDLLKRHADRVMTQPPSYTLTCVIEDVAARKAMYNRNLKGNIALNVAQKVGMCKQSQHVAESFINSLGVRLIKIPATKGNWAKNKAQFEKVTGWKGRSNEDTRSAAFFGFLGINQLRYDKGQQ